MKAWRFYAFGDMRLDEIELGACPPDHVLVEPLVVQPSITEALLAFGIPTLAYDNIKGRLETDAPLQLFGHEFCARILEVGSEVMGYQPGDRVAARAKLPCGDCPMCRLERSDDCRLGPIIGFQLPGCFAERALLPALALVKVDDRISDSEAATLQSLSDSIAGVETAQIRPGESVAVFGQGSMGIESMQAARACGAGQLITVDVRAEACQMSLELGADHAINANEDDPVEAIRDLTGGEGADVVFECAGGSVKLGLAGDRTLKQAIYAVRSGGRLVGVSWFGAPVELDVDVLRERSLRYIFPDISSQAHLEYTVRLVATGRINMKPTIRHVLEGIDKVPEAFEITANKGKYGAINPAQVVLAE
jgi:threonine dehydrogenase-like Zn-dependent dehydrogenase